MSSPILTIVSFLIIFTLIVVSHEFGHFLIARLSGIRVKEFMVGVGPVLYRKKKKETEFSIRLLPFGGACIYDGDPMAGDEEENVDRELSEEEVREKGQEAPGTTVRSYSYREAPVWGRIATVLAGPFFNFLLAYFLSLFLVWFSGADLPILASVMEGYPAEAAGMQAGDTIISIDGHRVHLWREISVRSLLNTGKPMEIVFDRNGERMKTTVTPAWSEEDQRYYIGFTGGARENDIACNNIRVFPYSWYTVRYWLDTSVQSLKYMFSGHMSLDNLAGPVGIANVIDDTIEVTAPAGTLVMIISMVEIAVLLSANLGVMNLLPLPALDGGRLLFLIFEAVSGKPVPAEKEGFVHLIGFVLLFILTIAVLFNDIGRFIR